MQKSDNPTRHLQTMTHLFTRSPGRALPQLGAPVTVINESASGRFGCPMPDCAHQAKRLTKKLGAATRPPMLPEEGNASLASKPRPPPAPLGGDRIPDLHSSYIPLGHEPYTGKIVFSRPPRKLK